jgi:hypothetical protein
LLVPSAMKAKTSVIVAAMTTMFSACGKPGLLVSAAQPIGP